MRENSLLVGNLDRLTKKNPKNRGWFLGQFINKGHPFHSEELELKWNEFDKGWKKQGLLENGTKTLVILISGKFRIKFKKEGKSYVLSKRGDFIYYKTTPHTGEALSNCLVLTVRWPSLKE